MEQWSEINIPQIEEKRNKNNNRKIVVIAALVCVVLGVAAAAAGTIIARAYNSPERRLIKGVVNLAKEAAQRQQLWEAENSSEALQMEASFNMSGDELPFTIGVDERMLRDDSAHKMQSDVVLSVMNNDILECMVYAEDDRIMISIPDIWRQNFEFHPDRIDRQYNNSLLAEKFGQLEGGDISLNLFPDEVESSSFAEIFEDWTEKYADNLRGENSGGFASKVSIEKLEEPVSVSDERSGGKSYKCSRYRIVIPKEWIDITEIDGKENIYMAGNDMTMEIESDMVLLIDMEKGSKIVRISMEEPVRVNFETEGYIGVASVKGSISFFGEERSIDDIVVKSETKLIMGLLEEELEKFGISDSSSLEEEMNLTFDTEIKYDKDDTRVTMEINELTISDDIIGDIRMTGTVDIEPLKEEILPLDGETIQIFEITEDEFDDLEEQLQNVLLKWFGIFSLMD